MKSPLQHKGLLRFSAFILMQLCISLSHLMAQDIANQNVDFKVHNEPLRSVLDRFATDHAINLSYNASEVAFNEIITYTASNKNVKEVLAEILAHINHEYKQVGNHFLIVRSSENPQTAAKIKAVNTGHEGTASTDVSVILGDTLIKIIEIPVYLMDTLRITDTIVKIEVERVRDTIFIDNTPVKFRRSRSLSGISNGTFRFEPDRDRGWALSMEVSPILGGFQYLNMLDVIPALDAESISLRNTGLGVALQYNRNRFSFIAGLGLTSFGNRFEYTEINSLGGFYKTDTLDIFYTIIQPDTNWIYVTDSTWIPLDRNELSYDQINRIGLIELQLGIATTIIRRTNYSIYMKAGIQVGTPLWLKGSSITDADGFPATKLNKEIFSNWLYAYNFGTGIRYKLGNWIDVYAEPFYKRYVNQTTTNHPLDRRLHGAGLQLGMIYFL
jgi:hypothetical protein